MKRLTLALLSAILVVSCASDPNLRTETPYRIVKQCSATPRNAISEWFRGIAEMSINALRALIPDGASVFEVFSNEGKHGQEIVRQILAHPVSGERGGCACTLLSISDDASNSHIKIVTVKRVVEVGDDDHVYKRTFHVRFDSRGNCILNIEAIDPKWERIVG